MDRLSIYCQVPLMHRLSCYCHKNFEVIKHFHYIFVMELTLINFNWSLHTSPSISTVGVPEGIVLTTMSSLPRTLPGTEWVLIKCSLKGHETTEMWYLVRSMIHPSSTVVCLQQGSQNPKGIWINLFGGQSPMNSLKTSLPYQPPTS